MRRRAFSIFLLMLVFGSFGLLGCNLDNAGDAPPRGKIYLPAGLMLSAATPDEPARFLYVVNSNFDLRYNAGSLQAFDLEAISESVERCAEKKDLGATTCELDQSEDFLADEVLVPSLATFVTASSKHDRIYVTTRTETNISVIDVDESSSRPVSCNDTDRVCDASHTRYSDPLASERRLSLPREAVAMASGDASQLVPGGDLSGEIVLVAHRAGEVSAFLDPGKGSQLLLQDVLDLGGSTRPVREPTGIVFDPVTHLAYVSIYARDLPSLSDKKILARVGIDSSGSADYPSSLFDAGVVSLEGVSLGRDTRGIALDPIVPGRALVASRVPNGSVLWVDLQAAQTGEGEPTEALVEQFATVGRGPTRVITGALGDRTVVIVSCFDARQIFILDAVTAETLSVIHNFSGPFEVALDSARRRLYVADFRSSVVRILDLAPLLDGASETVPTARIIATLGHPQLVQELQ